MKLLFTILEAAEMLSLSEGYVKQEIRAGRLVAKKIGRLTRVELSAIEVWIQQQPDKIAGSATVQAGSVANNPKNQVIEKTVGVRS